MTLGQKLKKLRTDKGLTQKDLADQLHVTFQTVSKWESDTNEPDIATLKELSKFFDCSFNYLLGEEDEEAEETIKEQVVPTPVEIVTKTVIVHQNEAHVCARCGKDIPENELASEDITKKERYGRTTRTVSVGQTYYHKSCLAELKQERAEAAKRAKREAASSSKKKCFGWSIAAGAVALIISLLIMLIGGKSVLHPAASIGASIFISYAVFAMIYCIISGSYLGDVFIWCATRSIRFPGIIFSFSIEGFAWLIAIKILFAILGFLFGLFFLGFAIVLSATLGSVSFPFVLIHNIHTEYEDCL